MTTLGLRRIPPPTPDPDPDPEQVATLVVLLRNSKPLGSISGVGDLREAIQSLAAAVSVEDNLIAAEVTPSLTLYP